MAESNEVMEPVVEEVVVDETDAEIAKAFASGYDNPDAPTEKAPPVVETVADPVVDEVTPEPVVETVATEPTTLTEAEIKDLKAKANSVDELRAAFKTLQDSAFGRIGGLERTIKELKQASVPAPVPQAVVLEELSKEYPDVSKALATDLGKVLAQGKSDGLTQEQIQEQMRAMVAEETTKVETRLMADRLTDLHADWREINAKNEFHTWLQSNGDAYREQVTTSRDPRFVAEALTKFKQTLTPAPKPDAGTRKQRLAEAIPAKGGASMPARAKEQTVEEAFAEGYAGVS